MRRRLSAASSLLLAAAACAGDEAHQKYMAALRGDEQEMGRAEQIRLVSEALALEPGRVAYWELRAIYRIDSREFAAAASDLDRAVQLADRAYLRYLRGLVACQRMRFEASLADFDAAISAQPENLQFYRGRSLARTRTGDLAGAISDARVLVEQAPHQAEGHYALGAALAAREAHREAVERFRMALDVRPELVFVRSWLEQSLTALGDLEASEVRAEVERSSRENERCAPCLDPFRY